MLVHGMDNKPLMHMEQGVGANGWGKHIDSSKKARHAQMAKARCWFRLVGTHIKCLLNSYTLRARDRIDIVWTPHFGSCVSHSMTSSIFI